MLDSSPAICPRSLTVTRLPRQGLPVVRQPRVRETGGGALAAAPRLGLLGDDDAGGCCTDRGERRRAREFAECAAGDVEAADRIRTGVDDPEGGAVRREAGILGADRGGGERGARREQGE